MKKILVLDFPGNFLFPPNGYGGIERWLWSMAKQSVSLGYEVILSGPLWQNDYLPEAKYFNKRLSMATMDDFIKTYGKVNYLIGGHEYWNDKDQRYVFSNIAEKSMSFQMMPNFIYNGKVFDNKKHFLFCFSDEMKNIYLEQNPSQSICLGEGIGEDPIKSPSEDYIVWIGRLDEEKSPHLAILVAQSLDMKIKIIGNAQYDDYYCSKYSKYFNHPLVEKMGTLSGVEKMDVISRASFAIYTCSRDWIEAAGMIFSEYSRSGVPIAALTWRKGTSAEKAVINGQTGFIANANPEKDDVKAAEILCEAAKKCTMLNRQTVWEIGNEYFSPAKLTQCMYSKLDAFIV